MWKLWGCGVPFVASRIPPVMEASNQKGGLFFEPENSQNLAETIKTILKDPELYKNLQKEGLDQSKKYQGENIGNELEKLFSSLL